MPANVTIRVAQTQQLLQEPEVQQKEITPSIDIDLPAQEVVESILEWLGTYDNGQFASETSLTNDIYNQIGRVSTSDGLYQVISNYQAGLNQMDRLKTVFPQVFATINESLTNVLSYISNMQVEAGGPIPIKRSAKRSIYAQTLSGEYKPQSQSPGTNSIGSPDMTVNNPVNVDKNLEVGENVFPEQPQEVNQDDTYKDRAKNYLTRGLDNLLKIQNKPGGLKNLTEQLMCIVRKLDKRYTNRPKE